MCLNARSILNKKTELNIMVEDIKPHIIGITESCANNDITDAELGLAGYVMFRKDRMGRRGGGVLLYIKETIPAYEVQLQEETDCNDAIWCKLVTGHTTVTIGVVYRCPNITKQSNGKIHNVITEVSKGDCIIMGDFSNGNIKWDTLQSTGVEDQTCLCLIQNNFLTSSYRVHNGAHPSHSSTLHFCDVVFAWYLNEMCTARHDMVQIACGCAAHTVFVLTVAPQT